MAKFRPRFWKRRPTNALASIVQQLVPASAGIPRPIFQKVLRNLERVGYLLWYHQPGQLVRRGLNRLRDRVDRPRPLLSATQFPTMRTSPEPTFAQLLPHLADYNHFSSAEQMPAQLDQGRLTLLNRDEWVGNPINWAVGDDGTLPHLWRFQLHYHEFLLRLPDPWPIIESWLNAHQAGWNSNNPHFGQSSWHPYCISRRVPIWLALLRKSPPENPLKEQVENSLAQQVHWLRRHLETDLGGNHLWDNARALVMAGCYFTGTRADGWRHAGLELLEKCGRDQLLETGEHFERSPMYQADLARGLHETACWVTSLEPLAGLKLSQRAVRMTRFLNQLRHPDGHFPLWGDCTFDGDQLEKAKSPKTDSKPKTKAYAKRLGDYFIYHQPGPGDQWHRSNGNRLIVDAGPMGPDHLPAHAHADLLTYEISAHGRRLIVDSGTYCYAGLERSAYRQSSAHNVAVVNNSELADTWSTFRMGWRGKITGRRAGRSGSVEWFWARHNAFAGQGVPRLDRVWILIPDGPWFLVTLARGPKNQTSLSKLFRRRPAPTINLKEFIHWHPDITPQCINQDASQWKVDTAHGPARWEPASIIPLQRLRRNDTEACETGSTNESRPVEKFPQPLDVQQTTGWYSERFYQQQSATVTTLEHTCGLPGIMGWTLSLSENCCRPRLAYERGCLLMNWQQDGRTRLFQLPLPD